MSVLTELREAIRELYVDPPLYLRLIGMVIALIICYKGAVGMGALGF